MRAETISRVHGLVQQLTTTLASCPGIELTYALDAAQAIQKIHTLSGAGPIAVNKSSVIAKELAPGLRAAGSTLLETYFDTWAPFQNRFDRRGRLPALRSRPNPASIAITRHLGVLREAPLREKGGKDFTGLLGVTCLSAAEGAAVILQHGRNIRQILGQARRLILVASLDKIVHSLEDALFQTRCTAIFGLEPLLADLRPADRVDPRIHDLPFAVPHGQTDGRTHLLLFDNGRSEILRSRYRDILQCIGCRACTLGCPGCRVMKRPGLWSPKEYAQSLILGEDLSPTFCLQCKTCRANCPLGIDLAGMILDARAGLGSKRVRPWTDALLSRAGTWEKYASSVSWLANAVAGARPVRWLAEKTLDVSSRRRLPKLARRTFARCYRSDFPPSLRMRVRVGGRVAYFAGCAANFLDPRIGQAVVRVLRRNRVSLVFPKQECCGISELFCGNLKVFRKRAVFNLRSLAAAGADVVTACSTCALALKQEYPRFVGTQEAEAVSRRTYDILEYLLILQKHGFLDATFRPMDIRLVYHAPCHLKALGQEGMQDRIRLLSRIPGLAVEQIDRGCCGMGGTFGLRGSNYERSVEIGRPLFEAIRDADPDRVATDCFACKLQIEEGTDLPVTHPILVLEEAYGQNV